MWLEKYKESQREKGGCLWKIMDVIMTVGIRMMVKVRVCVLVQDVTAMKKIWIAFFLI
jgi:hypothetical protein